MIENDMIKQCKKKLKYKIYISPELFLFILIRFYMISYIYNFSGKNIHIYYVRNYDMSQNSSIFFNF